VAILKLPAAFAIAVVSASAMAAAAMPQSAPQQSPPQSPPQSPSGVSTVIRTEYYEVHGRTAAEVAADMRKQGPKDPEGRAYAGFTASPVRWQYITIGDGPRCRALNVTVTVTSHVVLPRWVPPADTEPGLLAMWNRSAEALEVHEAGHRDVSFRYATQIRDGIVAMRAPCRGFFAAAKAASDSLVEAMRAAQAKYDVDTRHGLEQGTGFPPRAADQGGVKRP